MSVDDTLSRRIRDLGSAKGAFTARGKPEKAAAAHAEIQRLKLLRNRARADEALLAAGLDYETELKRTLS